MKKIVFVLIVTLLMVGSGVFIYQKRASAFTCSFTITGACGYFTDQPGFSDLNVLPGTALSNVSNVGGAVGTGLIATMSAYLNNSAVGGGGFQGQVGAAFIIDNMLRYKGTVGVPVTGSSQALGIAFAQSPANWNQWVSTVTFFANSTSPATYGINWSYYPPPLPPPNGKANFCIPGHPDSGYDPTRQDAELYQLSGLGPACDLAWAESMPEIQFYWPGGSFEIGKLCGNLQDSLSAIPAPNSAPTGTITVSCTNSTTGLQTATVNFSDPDGATTATIITGGVTLPTPPNPPLASGAVRTQPLPLPPTVNPYVPQPITLRIKDVGPTAVPGAVVNITGTTASNCFTLTCGNPIVTPTAVDPFMPFAITVSMTNTAGTPPGNFTFSLSGPLPGTTVFYTAAPQAPTNSGSVSSATFSGIPPLNSSGHGAGTYTANWTFGGKPCSGTFPVVYLPYLNVYGGDVSVGNSPSFSGGASTCATDGASGVYSWNNHSAGFTGAGAQFAVNALAGVVDFASAISSDNTAPTGLSFANIFNPADATKLNPAAGLFGGYFGGLGSDCDFTSDITSAPTPGGITITATTVPLSTSTVRYVSGDVYISGNIVYAGTAGWAGISQIPSFRLIVTGGDIYISSSVTQLDGLYVAEPNGAVGGRIFTCASAIGVPVNPQTPGSYTTCNQQLVINGAFVAKYVSFGRTFGSLGQATATDSLTSNHDAEVFNYTPELWVPRGSSPPNSGYTAITGLPPVL